MSWLKKGNSYRVTFLLVSIEDNITEKTGITAPTIKAMKVGPATRTVTSLSNATWTAVDAVNAPGLYTLDIDGTVTDTLGELMIRVSHSSVRAQVRRWDVRLIDPSDLLDVLDDVLGRAAINAAVTPKQLTKYRQDGSVLKTFDLTESAVSIQPFTDRVPV
ncbi:MAG: hypothetical protein HY760_07935 [Nitrospirae bacterium]|nr:hypothetical protein [Nitrospirota bacterium]